MKAFWTRFLVATACLSREAWSLSAQTDSTWARAQSQLGQVQGPATYGRTQGLTIFPEEIAVTAPGGCGPFNGTVNGYTPLSNYTANPASLTEFVARFKAPNGAYVLGKASSDNCGACNNSCPCANGTSWGFFPWQGSEQSAAAISNAPSDVSYYNNTFDILLQPPPGAGFSYSWVNASSLNAAGYAPFNISGLVPACVPLSAGSLQQQIMTNNLPPYADNSTNPITWRPQGAYPYGTAMGWYDLASGNASFTWYSNVYTITPAQGSGQSQIMVMNTTGLSTSPAPSQPGLQVQIMTNSSRIPRVPTQSNVLFPAIDNVTQTILYNGEVATEIPDLWQPAQLPDGCHNAVSAGANTSAPTFPITGTTSSTPSGVPTWYLPAASSTNLGDWYIAVLQTNQTVGRPLSNNAGWTLGRAYIDVASATWTAVFPKDGVEWNTSHLVAPAQFSILGHGDYVDDNGYAYDSHHSFVYGGHNATSGDLGDDTFFVSIGGQVPCCINSRVPAMNSSGTVPIGKVMGICDPDSSTANITWLGMVYAQDISQAQLLTMTVYLRPDPNRTAKIVGGVVGGVCGLLIIAALTALALYARRTYPLRAKKRLIQDQVYNLVMGVRHDDLFSEDIMRADTDAQGTINVDRFYNLLPFVNRMPRNQFYAHLSSRVAGRCMNSWSTGTLFGAKSGTNGVFAPGFHGYAGQTMAYAIMKHETCWASTDRAIVQQWQSGAKGRRTLVASVEETMQSPELQDFLEGMDGTAEEPEAIHSKGFLVMLSRTFFLTVPSYRVRHAGVDPAAAPENWNTKLDPIPEDPATSGLVSLRSTQFGASGGTSSDSKNKPALGLSMVLRQMQLDDYEIKPSEIEMMTKLDGAPAILGRGAFGEVFKAKYNSVQVVAVKCLREGGDERAKIDFLREVAIMKKLRAENIVRFLGVCMKDSKTMLVTEFMAGGDLFTRLSEAEIGGELSWYHMGRRIAADIARGLAFLHSQQIVHFDLKSPNILLARDNTAKVADVGLARFMNADHVTQLSVMGTMAWAAPEVLRGTKDCFSTKVDIYSFGVVLWEIVTGTSPRFGHDWFRPPRVPEECPGWAAELIKACMLEDASARPTSKEIYRMLLDNDDDHT